MACLAPRDSAFSGRYHGGEHRTSTGYRLVTLPPVANVESQARLTQLVVDAERQGKLPPTRISPDQLRHQHRQPTLPELKAAFSLHRLSRAIARRFCNQDMTYPKDRPSGTLGLARLPEDPDHMPEWNADVSHAVFRLLIVGAALAGAYNEPLLKALEHPDPEIKALLRRVPRDYSQANWKGEGGLGQKEMAFLLQFAVCDLDATLETQDVVFGPIAEWLLDSILFDEDSRQAMADRFGQGYGRVGFCLGRDQDEEPCPLSHLPDRCSSHSDAHFIVWELMKMFWLVEQVRPYGLQGSILDRRRPRPPLSQDDAGADDNKRGPPDSAVAVFFGMFRTEETLLPTTPAESPGPWLTTYPAVFETKEEDIGDEKLPKVEDLGDGKLPRGMSAAVFFDQIFNFSGRPNHLDNLRHPVAPLELKFFEYFLQRHLGLCLDSQAFREDELEYMEGSYQEFVETITIFSRDDVENRCPYDYSGYLVDADFLDGSEMLTKYPSSYTRFYQPKQ